jgi:hypothetical protein
LAKVGFLRGWGLLLVVLVVLLLVHSPLLAGHQEPAEVAPSR